MGFEVIPIMTMQGNAYLLKGNHIGLVDTLTPWRYKKLVARLGDFKVSVGDIEFILVTHHHFDHCGNLAKIKSISGATVIAGEADTPVIEGTAKNPPPSKLSKLGRALAVLPEPVVNRYQRYEPAQVDRKVAGGETIEEFGLEVIAVPGHTAGGVAYFDKEGRRAFVGDMVSNFYARPGMPALSASESLEDIFASQEILSMLDLDIAYPGHGVVLQPNASKIINDFTRAKKAEYGK
jgi:glyoxylase-like metal-dependent hydrolase (beta-lactamase superfamily II)